MSRKRKVAKKLTAAEEKTKKWVEGGARALPEQPKEGEKAKPQAVIVIQPPEEAKPKPPEPRILYPGRDFYHEFACPACGHEKSGFAAKPEPINNPRGHGGEQWGRFTCGKCGCVWAAAPKE